jgi:hypothetical protein
MLFVTNLTRVLQILTYSCCQVVEEINLEPNRYPKKLSSLFVVNYSLFPAIDAKLN